ncbi:MULTISPECIES: hypothetical protein [Streptomyces rochei group]|uniref:hypothetical protein n=1 Tax=Streptomyces rochei group TaxID=2867164 RepID=UPI001996796E|nr:hypothetical protein [Streptomyces vinaceusdrappus]GHC44314.1 hypothetical protein GCM10010308_74440 [Streptomyces vinaceusdrappus]
MNTPPAAVAVVRATIEDAHLAELLQRPGATAQRVIRDLEDAGWTIAPTGSPSAPQRAA